MSVKKIILEWWLDAVLVGIAVALIATSSSRRAKPHRVNIMQMMAGEQISTWSGWDTQLVVMRWAARDWVNFTVVHFCVTSQIRDMVISLVGFDTELQSYDSSQIGGMVKETPFMLTTNKQHETK